MSLPTLPITLLLFLTTKGYADCRTIYRTMLDGLDRQLPLRSFGLLYAHLKITPGEESVAEQITADLKSKGFVVESATASWERGQVHFNEYLKDQIKVSKDARIYDNPFIFWLDHDYVPICKVDPFPKVLYRMTELLLDPNVLTSRFLREQDVDALTLSHYREPDNNLAWHPHVNWQPLIMRSRDFFISCKIIEDNWTQAQKMHGEALWREVLGPLSRGVKKHAVWLPEYAQVANLGVPEYRDVAKRLNLQIYPNPV